MWTHYPFQMPPILLTFVRRFLPIAKFVVSVLVEIEIDREIEKKRKRKKERKIEKKRER